MSPTPGRGPAGPSARILGTHDASASGTAYPDAPLSSGACAGRLLPGVV